MKDLVVGIIGGGVVGRTTARTYLGHVKDVRVWDRLPERRTCEYRGEILNSDLVFVCLPTPQKKDSLECDTSVLAEFFGSITHSHDLKSANFVLKSTVPVGTTRRLAERYDLPNLVHSPEFLTARCADVDSMVPTRNIIGELVGKNEVSEFSEFLYGLYQERFPGIPIYQMTAEESEAVKLFQNAYSAVKVSLFNEFRGVSDKLDLDWEAVRHGLLAGGWIEPMHTQVPGPDGQFGYGGSCLPKDLASLVYQGVEAGLDMSVCNAARMRNSEDRKR